MSRRRAKVTKASADLYRPANAVVQSARVPAVSLAVALLLMLSFVVPFILSANPYPEGVVRYWLWGTAVTAGVAVLVSLSPLRKPSAAGCEPPVTLSGHAQLGTTRHEEVSRTLAVDVVAATGFNRRR